MHTKPDMLQLKKQLVWLICQSGSIMWGVSVDSVMLEGKFSLTEWLISASAIKDMIYIHCIYVYMHLCACICHARLYILCMFITNLSPLFCMYKNNLKLNYRTIAVT